ncbi:hypothetical protein [Sphingosinicella humi]|uniref:Uncharacterized protein n=1 Tax=Allosphingosinicella humi TaxID=2068657 RepID=A0A2U2J666_9SPHN|nr:hypothetical protein [Sphingosinicella humi]PWG03807.1 hypothetical protein DF286_02985 [Sphingosinicella humi]
MTHVETKVLSTVNAPYGANLSACQLAAKIADPKSASSFDASVFSFFSEVKPVLQTAFIEAMGVDKNKAHCVASQFAAKSGFPLALAN